MPFTQQEIDEVWRVSCAFHGTTPEALGIEAPKIATIVPRRERKILRLFQQFNRLCPRVRWR